jgi:hypothetical protein
MRRFQGSPVRADDGFSEFFAIRDRFMVAHPHDMYKASRGLVAPQGLWIKGIEQIGSDP